MLKVPFNPERDLRWSDLMLSAEDKCECEWMDVEDLLFNSITKMYKQIFLIKKT